MRAKALWLSLPLLALACGDPVSNPGESLDQPLLAKPDNPGKGGGGGGGAPPDPAIAIGDGGSIWLVNEDGSNATQILDDAYFNPWPSWSPLGDGSATNPYRLIFHVGLCQLAAVDVDTVGGAVNASNRTSFPTPNNACAPSWSPLGDEIAYGGSQEDGTSSLYVIPVAGGAPTALYTGAPGNGIGAPTWSPDGSALAFTEDTVTGSNPIQLQFAIRIFNRPTGAVTTVVSFGDFHELGDVDWASTHELLAFRVLIPTNGPNEQDLYTIALSNDVNGNFIAAGPPSLLVENADNPSWSPDDSKLALREPLKNKIAILDIATGTTERIRNGSRADWRR